MGGFPCFFSLKVYFFIFKLKGTISLIPKEAAKFILKIKALKPDPGLPDLKYKKCHLFFNFFLLNTKKNLNYYLNIEKYQKEKILIQRFFMYLR